MLHVMHVIKNFKSQHITYHFLHSLIYQVLNFHEAGTRKPQLCKIVSSQTYKQFAYHRCTRNELEMSNPRIVVVGSCMIDLVSYAPRLPCAGETLTGQKFQQGYGGKGANQCVAAARLGSETALVARLGDDSFGYEYLKSLENENVCTKHVSITNGSHSGMAQIVVAKNGENQIVIVPGANTMLCEEDVLNAKDIIEAADVLLFQLETPIEATVAALKLSKGKGKRIVNAAPASVEMNPLLFSESDIFCVNESEAEQLCSFPVKSIDDAINAAKAFQDFGCKTVVVTLGAEGVVFLAEDDSTPCHISAPKVQAVDTTGAGDVFLGAMAYYLAYNPELTLKEIIHRSCNVASISVQSRGTQSSFPHRKNLPASLV